MKRNFISFGLAFLALLHGSADAASVVDASTMNKKVMAGYQGWFMTGSDGSGAGWRHWASSTPNASNIDFEMWPDLREYAASELTATSFKYANGKVAGLYSAYNATTVERHVKWMADYDIDGVFVQRFIGEAINMRSVRDKVLQNVRYASEKHGRVFANMYDISGGSSSTVVNHIKNDWMHLVDNLKITQSTRHLRHNGLPVVSIWGFGVSGRPGSAAQLRELITWFKSGAATKYRATVKLGVDDGWRSHSPDWQSAYRSAAVISPWSVGRYANNAGADSFRNDKIAPDLAALKNTGIAYMPVVWPGFSWWNLQNGTSPLNKIPRNGGRFFWRQAYNAQAAGANMTYVAMFDEVDEGTAMFKIAENASQVPTTGKFLTLNADGENLPSDWYLRLMGEASRMMKQQRALVATMPSDPLGTGTPTTDTPTATNSLQANQQLGLDQYRTSTSGKFRVYLQGDGNLVLKNLSTAALIWSSNTPNKGGQRLVMQGDGNLVLYSTSGAPLWATGTTGGSYLMVQGDGNLVLFSASGTALWASNTSGLSFAQE
jgi:hypothetical protein